MSLLVDREGCDQTAFARQTDLGLCFPHIPKDMFSHGATHIAQTHVKLCMLGKNIRQY